MTTDRKYTDEELVSMTQQYTQDRAGNFVTHLAYEEINRQGAAGRQWSKCANCGNPYPLTPDWGDMTVCSSECFDDYLAYVQDESQHLGSYGHWEEAGYDY